MKKILLSSLLLVFQLNVFAAPQIDQSVLKRIDEMGIYIRSLSQFELNAKSTFDVVMDNDQTAEREEDINYKVKTPNKIFVEIHSDYKHREYYYNGKTLTIYAPDVKLFGEIPAPPTIPELVNKAHESGIEMPISDLFDWGTPKAKEKQITSAQFVGKHKKGSTVIDHFAVRQGQVDWQIWIPRGNKPLPQKLILTTLDDPAKPKYNSLLEWNTKPDFKTSNFNFKPPKGSYKIDLKPQTSSPTRLKEG